MSDILAGFGVGGDDLASQLSQDVSYPVPTQGRVAHIDADFISYQVSAETKDELAGLVPRKSLEDMQHNARNAAEHLMRLVGATSYRCHITPSGSNKGGRPDQAVQQEYQGGRKSKEKPEFLDATRAFIGQELNGVVHLDQEADDGLCQANYAAMGPGGSWGDSNLSVIVSKDKDLRMVPGLHWDFDSEEVFTVGNPFGSIWLDEKTKADPATGKTKVVYRNVKGWGTKFFWAQCMMGDAADSIKGIPKCPIPGTPKAMACGPVLTHQVIKDVHNDRDAFHLVKERWCLLESEHGYEFKHWRTGERVTATQALLGDMLLLWMRRNKNPRDVIDWLKEVTA